MSQIKYHFAYDENGDIVNIDDVIPEERNNHNYRCIGCDAPMGAKIGQIRAGHFAHKSNVKGGCGIETYLHKLGKRLLKEKFDSERPFDISYYQEVTCDQKVSCLFYREDICKEKQRENFNLKEYYDTCEEEKAIGAVRADLLLTNSKRPNINPILIEIQVTHKSSPSKIDLQKQFHIIELRIQDEENIISFRENPLTESPDKVSFYGFKRQSDKKRPLSRREITRFCLYSNGSAHIPQTEDMVCCLQRTKRLSPHSIIELNFEPPAAFGDNIYELGYVYALREGLQFKTCALCKYRRNSNEMMSFYTEGVHFCCLYKSKGTPRNPESKHANQCEFYRINQDLVNGVEQRLSTMKVEKI